MEEVSNFKVYVIKCKTSEKSYLGYTDSTNEKYNPLFYLYNKYKQDKSRYISLGESVEQYKLRDHITKFIKENLTKDEAINITKTIREKLGEKCLNDVPKSDDIFGDEMSILNSMN